MRDEPWESEKKDREEPEGPEEHAIPDGMTSVVSIVQQNAVIINGRRAPTRGRDGGWI